MKTKDPANKVTELPPPPAPTARDANPWPLSGGAVDGHATTAARRRGAAQAGAPGAGDSRRRSFLQGAAVPLVAALFMGVFAFLRGRKGESFEEYRGLLIALAVIAFIVISRIGARSSSGGKRDGGASR